MNNPKNTLARLETFYRQSQKLLELAQADNWQEFELLLQERQQGLASLGDNAFLIDIAREGLATEAKTIIESIRQIDDQIIHSAEHSKTEITEKLRHSFQASKAITAYQK